MRNKGNNGERLDTLEKDVSVLKREMEQRKTDYNTMLERNIVDDLIKTRPLNANKHEYTYEEIAQKNSVPKSYDLCILKFVNLILKNRLFFVKFKKRVYKNKLSHFQQL